MNSIVNSFNMPGFQTDDVKEEIPKPHSNESIGVIRAGDLLDKLRMQLRLGKDDNLTQEQRMIALKYLGGLGFDIDEGTETGRRTRQQLGIKLQKPNTSPKPDSDESRGEGTNLANPKTTPESRKAA